MIVMVVWPHLNLSTIWILIDLILHVRQYAPSSDAWARQPGQQQTFKNSN